MIASNKHSVDDPVAIALRALAWTVSDQARADRMLALTGLDSDDLRDRAMEPAVLAALLGFLEAFEPDLIACAEALAVRPQALVDAREALEA
ncbi:DUF3572 family protein [Sphingomonas crusticola]|uniref:DUF3572 family protein n=1 Tax=Sphingomonas crusticola TaxID=1697973 RepID=UPI000E248811|nr:DUF3572 family protein [Sphingomonas crusticola]